MKLSANEPALPKQGVLYNIVTNLTFWVLIAIIAGILLGHFAPAIAMKMEFLGKRFIDLIKLFIGPIIFLTIVLGIGGMGDLRKVGRIGIKSLIYFEIVTTFALAIGVAVAYLFQPGKIDKSGLHIQDPTKYTSAPADFSWLQFFLDNFTLNTGVSVRETKADINTAPATTIPNSRNRRPTKPSKNIMGRNMTAIVIEVAITAK